MARISFKRGDDYALKLSQLATKTEATAKRAIYKGAAVLADKIKENLNALPSDTFRRLPSGEIFKGVPETQKQDLSDGFGITPISRDENGDWNAKIGFDGYGKYKTKKYPQGVPNQLLARSIESGSSVRRKTPFVRPAVNAAKADVLKEMRKIIDDELKKTMGG